LISGNFILLQPLHKSFHFVISKPPVTQTDLGQYSLSRHRQKREGCVSYCGFTALRVCKNTLDEIPEGFPDQCTCTYSVQVLVEVCSYSFHTVKLHYSTTHVR